MSGLENRKQYIDILRALAAIGVIFIHVSAQNWYGYVGSTNWIVFTIYEGLFRFSVPVFFMISGCLFLNSKKEKQIKALYSNSIKKLVLFLLFWALVYKVVQISRNEFSASKIIDILIEIIRGDTQAHLWFLYSLIGLYILVPLLKPAVQNSTKEQLAYIVTACFILGSICEFLGQFQVMGMFTNIFNKVKSGFSVGYVGYFLLGAYIDKYNIDNKHRKLVYLFGVLGTVMTIGLVIWDCVYTQTLNERFWSYTMPWVYLTSAALFLAIRNVHLSENNIYKAIAEISNKSRGVYGVHFLFILIFWKVGFSTFSFIGILSVPVISAIVVVLSYFFSALLMRIPVVGKYIA